MSAGIADASAHPQRFKGDPDFDSDFDPEEEKPQQGGGGDGIPPPDR